MTVLARLKARDPDLLNLRKAARAMLVCVPLFAVLKLWFGLDSIATFSFFSSFVGLVFADYGGPPGPRSIAYLAMIVIGNLVIVIGSLLSGSLVGGAIAMFLVMFTVNFATIFGGYAPAFIAPVALAYSLTVLDPLTSVPLDERLIGWTIGGFAALVAALVMWPVDRRRALRETLATVSDALGDTLASIDDKDAREAAYKRLNDALADARRKVSAPFRPSGPRSRDIGLLQLVQHLEQSGELTRRVLDCAPHTAESAKLIAACVHAFRRTAADLRREANPRGPDATAPTIREALDAGRHSTDRAAIKAEEADGDSDKGAADAIAVMRRSFPVFALAHIAMWTEAAAAAGLGVQDQAIPATAPESEAVSDRPLQLLLRSVEIARREFDLSAVIFRNSLRAAAAMTLAVILAKILPVQHGFWITLGALLVLRSSAGATSATALQAVAGTLMGFVVASIILWTAETSVGPLWAILPASIFLAGYAPGAIGFMIGQASFTTALVVLFTLIYPAGIDTAIERVETVTLGAISAAVIGLLLWPHGARAALAATVARVYRTAAAGMRGLLGGTEEGLGAATAEMLNARRRADEAFGVALNERGRHLDTRLWLALFKAPNLVHCTVAGLVPEPEPWLGKHCGDTLQATARHRDAVADLLDSVAERLETLGPAPAGQTPATEADDLLPLLESCFERALPLGVDRVADARHLVAWNWWLSSIQTEVAGAGPELDTVVDVSKPEAWLRWSTPEEHA
ncbi:MAG: FUSC family protein [Bauldia sp.]|uniref:FUSC family protein n=1 Tax=Bauldia sp. TaxID=2575872 RepID=UPI001DD67B8E|nr:FUSC family protein [Bauldia sp.]MCB1497260.1 FUSC family protein [Bauldia sp.]